MDLKFFTKKTVIWEHETHRLPLQHGHRHARHQPRCAGPIGCSRRNGAAGYVNVHVTQNSTRAELAQLQKDLSAVNIGFRYDMVDWVEGKLQSIRFALILQDGTMVRNAYDAMGAETDIWIRLEGTGEERVFCAGSKCAE